MTSFSVLSLLIVASLNINVPMNRNELPKTWTKDFIINYSFNNTMGESSTELTISYDSCRYERYSRVNGHKKGVYVMTEADRKEILEKMRELKVNNVKSEMSIGMVHDGWSESLSIGSHWIHGGTSAKMKEKDKEIFALAHSYLTGFAEGKVK